MAIPRPLFLSLCLLALANSQISTTVVTATRTITVTASGACNNFVGACVVYGEPGAAPYTTTIFAGTDQSPASATATSTTVSDDATGASACANFDGTCVVYGSGAEGGSYSTTVYNGANQPQATLGNSDGYIGPAGSSDGYIGGASSLSMGILLPLISFMLVNVGFFVWM